MTDGIGVLLCIYNHLLWVTSFDWFTQEDDTKVSNQTQHLHNLQQKAEDAASRVANLEAALMVCKEELTMYIEQLEETKDKHEFEIESKNEKVGSRNYKMKAWICGQACWFHTI